jgi:hypothetical protein
MVNVLDRTSSLVSITQPEVCQMIDSHYSQAQFKQVLERAASNGDALLRVIGRFFQCSAAYGPGQAALAAQISVRKDLFSTRNEVGVFADQSVEVGAGIFFGAIDEFGDRELSQSFSHRILALAMLKGMALFFGADMERLSHDISQHDSTQDIFRHVSQSYGVNALMDEAALFRGIGFHLGTEVLGEAENRVLDEFFQTKRPDVMDFLNQTDVEVNGHRVPANIWFKRHIVAEAEHFDAGIAGANQALLYYAGTADRQQVKQWMLEGVKDVANVQVEMMASILND